MKKGTSAAVRTFIIVSDLFMKSSVIDSMQNTSRIVLIIFFSLIYRNLTILRSFVKIFFYKMIEMGVLNE